MPNQYTKVTLQIEIEEPIEYGYLQKNLTNSVFEILKEKLPKEVKLIEQLIKEIKEQL